MNLNIKLLSTIAGLIKKIEKLTFIFLGKGFGSFSISQEVNLACALLKGEPKLVIDIGGNVGNYSAAFIKKHPNINIHIFEPASINVKKLSDKFYSYKNIKINQLAISNKKGKGIIHSDIPGSGLASLTKRNLNHFNIPFDEVENVKTIKFEDYWAENLNGINVDVLKIDIDGHEFEALQGLEKCISFIKIIQFEFGGCNIDTRTFFQDFYYFFKRNNFTIFRITPIGLMKIDVYSESDEVFLTTNFLALNNTHAP